MSVLIVVVVNVAVAVIGSGIEVVVAVEMLVSAVVEKLVSVSVVVVW